MKPLHEIAALDAVKRYWHFFCAPAWVSLILGLASSFSEDRIQTILVNAVTGQMALTLVKLLLYVSLFLLGLGTLLKDLPYLAVFCRWSGARIADVTFDYTSCAVGVFVGLIPALVIDLGAQKAIGLVVYVISIFVGLQGCLWVASNLAYGHFDKHFQRHNLYSRIFIRIAGAVLLSIALFSFFNEKWSEVPPQKAPSLSKTK
jgi:threonine/homoserine/homoserine lactone efflux protein